MASSWAGCQGMGRAYEQSIWAGNMGRAYEQGIWAEHMGRAYGQDIWAGYIGWPGRAESSGEWHGRVRGTPDDFDSRSYILYLLLS